MLKQLPNLFTLANLSVGFVSILLSANGDLLVASLFILAGAIFDFFDGFLAKRLNASSELGKQLDSLADLVTFGVSPAILMYYVLLLFPQVYSPYANYIVVLIPVFSALRLAKFNIDSSQSVSFTGLPTPANALFFVSISIFIETLSYNLLDYFNPYGLLICLVIIFSYLLTANLSFFSLKFEHFRWKSNEIRFLFLSLGLILIIITFFMDLVGLTLAFIILLYVIFSLINNLITKNEIQS